MSENPKATTISTEETQPKQPNKLYEPEGVMKVFQDIYNDKELISHVRNKSLRTKLERLRAEMGVDFYNIDQENFEKFEEFAGKYIPQRAQLGLSLSGISIQLEHSYVGLMLGYDHETNEYKGLNTYKTIVDKVMDGTKLTDDEVRYIQDQYFGQILQKKKQDGAWTLKRTFYFASFGVMYRTIYDFVIQVSAGRIDVRRCEAPLAYSSRKCGKLFLPYPGGHEQRFCSKACKMRSYRKAQRETASK